MFWPGTDQDMGVLWASEAVSAATYWFCRGMPAFCAPRGSACRWSRSKVEPGSLALAGGTVARPSN